MIRHLLSDRGIREAQAEGYLKIYPEPDDKQRQPASIDLKFSEIVDSWPLARVRRDTDELRMNQGSMNVLLPMHENEVKTTTSVAFGRILMPFVEMRSSMRRMGCYCRVPIFNGANGLGPTPEYYTVTIEVVNHSNLKIRLNEGDRIGQMLMFFDSPPISDLNDPTIQYLAESPREDYKRLLRMDHGTEVVSKRWLDALILDGYMRVEPRLKLRKGFVELHAGRHARVLRKGVKIDFAPGMKLSGLLEEVTLPYVLEAGEFIDVDTVESLSLSKYVGMVFYNEHIFDYLKPSKLAKYSNMDDLPLTCKWDGWVDPGYDGSGVPFSRQPKTNSHEDIMIREGDVLGYGHVFYFPNGVERSYGSRSLGSHYQNNQK